MGIQNLWHQAKIARQGSLLWVLAVAVEEQLPLADEVEALADDSRGPWRRRLYELAGRLRGGDSLPTALERLPGILPRPVVLTIRVGSESGTLGPALRMAAESFTGKQETVPHAFNSILLYVGCVLLVMTLVLSFIMYFIIPKFKKIFEDFGTELPSLTEILIDASDEVAQYWYLFVPVVVVLAYLVIYLHDTLSARQLPRDGPFFWVGRLFPRVHVPDILRMLVVVVEGGRPLAGALSTIAVGHPDASMRRRLSRIGERVMGGDDVWPLLAIHGLLRDREAALLSAAQRAGNLPWALRELANQVERKLEFRMNVLLEFLRPVLLLGMGCMVAFVIVGMFMPLVKLLNDLS